jgi:hypothetical protein
MASHLHKNIRTPFVFLDETGSINDKANRYFAIGIIKCMQPYFLDYVVRLSRQKYRVFDEIKWNTISRNKLPILHEIIDQFFSHQGVCFASIVVNKDGVDFRKTFDNDPYTAYQKFSELLLKRVIKPNEIVTIIADYISTPHHVHFEVDTKHSVNKAMNRLAIAGIHRIDSCGTNMLQVTDLLLGAVSYEYKLNHKLVKGDPYKREIMDHVRDKVGGSFGQLRDNNKKFTVIEYERFNDEPLR